MIVTRSRCFAILSAALLTCVLLLSWPHSPAPRAQGGVDVFVNVTGGGTKKFNIAIPEEEFVTK